MHNVGILIYLCNKFLKKLNNETNILSKRYRRKKIHIMIDVLCVLFSDQNQLMYFIHNIHIMSYNYYSRYINSV